MKTLVVSIMQDICQAAITATGQSGNLQ